MIPKSGFSTTKVVGARASLRAWRLAHSCIAMVAAPLLRGKYEPAAFVSSVASARFHP